MWICEFLEFLIRFSSLKLHHLFLYCLIRILHALQKHYLQDWILFLQTLVSLVLYNKKLISCRNKQKGDCRNVILFGVQIFFFSKLNIKFFSREFVQVLSVAFIPEPYLHEVTVIKSVMVLVFLQGLSLHRTNIFTHSGKTTSTTLLSNLKCPMKKARQPWTMLWVESPRFSTRRSGLPYVRRPVLDSLEKDILFWTTQSKTSCSVLPE